MKSDVRMADFDHPAIQQKAAEVTAGRAAPLDKLQAIFDFVRDEIAFGFTPTWDLLKASEVMRCGLGYCNTKATLLVALCRACGIASRPTKGSHHMPRIRLEATRKPPPNSSRRSAPRSEIRCRSLASARGGTMQFAATLRARPHLSKT